LEEKDAQIDEFINEKEMLEETHQKELEEIAEAAATEIQELEAKLDQE